MKKIVKYINIFLLCAIVIFSCNMNSFAYISCDGNINLYEWNNIEEKILFRPHDTTGCCYNSASAKVKYIEEDRRVYLAIFIDNGDRKDFNKNETKAIVSFNKSSDIILNTDSTAEYDKNEFVVRFGYCPDDTGGGSYEADIVLKEVDFEDILTLNITLIDYLSNKSQTFKVEIKSEELKEEEEEESRSLAEEESRDKENKKTTKKKESKTTKKETTTVVKTAIVTEDYNSYSENLDKNNKTILYIGGACVLTSLGAMLVVLFKKK